jgi:large subunit ribosomal protein L1
MATKKTTPEVEAEIKAETPVVATDETATEKPEVTETVTDEPKEDKKAAKAGKRSEKSLKEADEKAEKEARKAAGDTTPQDGEAKVAQKQNPTRSRLERRGKAYRAAAENIEKGKTYSLKDALELAAKTSVGKFDGTIEVHVNLNVDPRQADQNLRGTVTLPNGTGKTVRVAAFVAAEQVEAVKKAGADIAGEEDIIKMLDKQQLDFDVLVSTPQMMAKLGKYARVLGPRGLMPNPKSGTVAANAAKAVEEAKAGRVEYRVDKQSIIHLGIGKKSFGGAKLHENAKVFFDTLAASKPASVKGALVKSIAVTSTMGPGVKVDTSSL